MTTSNLNVDFWQERYETRETPWDLGGPSPHLDTLLQDKPDWLTPGKVAVFGAGRGHDAALFARHGFEVTGFDYAEGAVRAANETYGDAVTFRQQDIFELAAPENPWAGQFDYLVEHTCFCAILPKQRLAYAQSARNILKPGGRLIGIFWEHQDPDGPPFSTKPTEIIDYFGDGFEVENIDYREPAEGRGGREYLAVLRKR